MKKKFITPKKKLQAGTPTSTDFGAVDVQEKNLQAGDHARKK